MDILLAVIFLLLGSAIGSFLNVCIDRLPRDQSLLFPSSHCDACQHKLAPPDLIPIFSYLFLHRRCRYCGTTIPARSLWVEICTGLLFVFLYWHYGLSLSFLLTAVYCSLFLTIFFIDLEHQLILNKIVYPVVLVVLAINFFVPQPGILDRLLPQPPVIAALISGANGLISGLIGFTLLLIPAIISRGGMGWGDVKMAALIGLVTGFPGVLVALLLGVILGGLTAIVLLAFKIKKRKEAMPFGPFLSLATMATLIWGSAILHWYLALF